MVDNLEDKQTIHGLLFPICIIIDRTNTTQWMRQSLDYTSRE